MKYIKKLIIVLVFSLFLTSCSDIEVKQNIDINTTIQITNIHTDNPNPTTAIMKPQSQTSNPVTKIAWKLIKYVMDYDAPYFDLYVIVDGKDSYYAGYFYGGTHLTDKNSSSHYAPENALTSFGSWWAGGGEEFYIYQKNETELALMNRMLESQIEEQDEFKEILIIPIKANGKIEIDDPIQENKQYTWIEEGPIIYDGFVLGGMNGNKFLPAYDYNFQEYIKGNESYRIYENGKYLDTASGSSIAPYEGFGGGWAERIELQYKGKSFNGLATNYIYPVKFGKRTYQNTSIQVYKDYIAEILANNGLKNEHVNIDTIIRTDIEDDGVDEVLIIASNTFVENKIKGQYSIVVLRKIINGKVESLFLVKDILTNLPTDISDKLYYKYELCEIVDLNHDKNYELLIKREYYEGYCYQVYKLIDNEFRIVLENGSEV